MHFAPSIKSNRTIIVGDKPMNEAGLLGYFGIVFYALSDVFDTDKLQELKEHIFEALEKQYEFKHITALVTSFFKLLTEKGAEIIYEYKLFDNNLAAADIVSMLQKFYTELGGQSSYFGCFIDSQPIPTKDDVFKVCEQLYDAVKKNRHTLAAYTKVIEGLKNDYPTLDLSEQEKR
jgi:hypothetical protein